MYTNKINYIIFVLAFLITVILSLDCKDHIVSPTFSARDSSWIFLGLKNETISSIAIDPTNASIIYAGSIYNFSAGTPGRLFKSTNRGKTWDTLTTNYNAQFTGIVIDPRNHLIIHAAWWGLIKSDDGGNSWLDEGNGIIVTPGETHIMTLMMDPNNPNVMYAGTAGEMAGRLYKSTDGGANWATFPNNILGDGITSIALSPTIANNLYVGTEFTGTFGISTDSGNSWKFPGFSEKGTITTITSDPRNQQRVLIGTSMGGVQIIWISEDGGNSFQPFNDGIPDNFPSCNSLVFNPSFQFDLYEGGYGVYHKTDRNSSWIAMNEGLPENSRVQVLTLAQDYNMYAGTMAFEDSLRKGGIYRRKIGH